MLDKLGLNGWPMHVRIGYPLLCMGIGAVMSKLRLYRVGDSGYGVSACGPWEPPFPRVCPSSTGIGVDRMNAVRLACYARLDGFKPNAGGLKLASVALVNRLLRDYFSSFDDSQIGDADFATVESSTEFSPFSSDERQTMFTGKLAVGTILHNAVPSADVPSADVPSADVPSAGVPSALADELSATMTAFAAPHVAIADDVPSMTVVPPDDDVDGLTDGQQRRLDELRARKTRKTCKSRA